jgi:hypothetical protein
MNPSYRHLNASTMGLACEPVDRVRALRLQGFSIRRIAHLLDMPRATVGDLAQASAVDVDPVPFYTFGGRL